MNRKNHIVFSKTEIICLYIDKLGRPKNKLKKAILRYNNVQSVLIRYCRERKGLIVKDSERIIIRSPLLPRQVEFYKFKEGILFDDYKAGLRLFCKTNKVIIYDDVED